MTIDLNIFNVRKQPSDLFDQPLDINMIDELVDNEIMNVDNVLNFFQDYFGQDLDVIGPKDEVNKMLVSTNQELESFPLPLYEASESVVPSPP